jgi:LPXTG-motif cell wall-anchored protein
MLVVIGVVAFVGISVTAASADDIGVVVNGQAIHGEGSRKLSGCALTVEVANAPAGPEPVHLSVRGHQPSGTAVVLEENGVTAGGSWSSGALDMSQRVADAGLQLKSNGYHLRIEVDVAGLEIAHGLFWLACGVDQHEGHSWAVQFTASWTDARGSAVPAPSTGVGPPLVVEAESRQGTAQCGYVNGAWFCVYERAHGHEDEEPDEPAGLRVSGRGTYAVDAVAVPAEWTVDRSTVGEFSPRAECGTEEPEVSPDNEEPRGRTVCVHNISFHPTDAPTATSTVDPAGSTAVTSSTSGALIGGGRGLSAGSDELPRTGDGSPFLAVVALVALAAGGAFVASTRRNHSHTRGDTVS